MGAKGASSSQEPLGPTPRPDTHTLPTPAHTHSPHTASFPLNAQSHTPSHTNQTPKEQS